ncbi:MULTISPECIES: hypothetical protein [Cupriavidus]|jgi:hypothetical protein|uniref:hypothetical protein n=1 Tax=Cupriavidus TaxID=106589 RepID=UPI0004467F07|nr:MULTISPECIES: hypothetical protein [Cupriavidus]KDP84533.1 hypothetical protein CF70_018690 [Cupriavidus sp. SK-3]KJK24690.1 hypothetical protein UB46_08185 [Burkholderiaceae bacterium 16]MDF3886178.1 hypothetical protein [Cupriavidus basilensis]
MSIPSYEVARLASLAVRLALSSGLSHEEMQAALSLAATMIEQDEGATPESTAATTVPHVKVTRTIH